MNYILRKSRAQEARLAKKHGGRVQPGSGCGKNNKGDVKTKRFLIEAKRTDKQQFTLTARVIRKIEMEAAREGKEPLLQIDMAGYRLYVMLEHSFEEVD